MNPHSLKVLEFDRFLELLSRHAASEPGRTQLLAVKPSSNEAEIDGMRRLYAETLALRRQAVDLPAARFASPEEALIRAAPDDAVLEPDAVATLREVLEKASDLRGFLAQERCLGSPALQSLAAQLDPCAELRHAIDRILEPPEGRIRDTASDRLHGIRSRLTAAERHIRERLEALTRDESWRDLLQEDFVTTRHGRHVLAVRREYRARLKGIVHDQSNSGGTLFVEPEAVVEAGNELELLHLEERDEIRRILAGLTARIRGETDTIRRNADLLCLYDMAFAVSAWARDGDCRCVPSGTQLRLVGARHPLLQARLAQEDRLSALVPLDFTIPEKCNVVVITGSNTGGKTVALKTLGLLTLVAQCGFPIPAAEGSAVRFFNDVRADIGDEQSIEQSLSTFSAHLEHVIETLTAAAAAPALLLFDELGAGTDPVEGGALACAILDALSRTAALTVATTHLGAVKRFVHAHPRMANASMRFDVETLRPQYRLMMGRAGASYALTIAERLGLAPEVVAAARGLLSEGDVHTESLLHALDEQQGRMDREIRELERLRDEAVQARDAARRDYERVSLELESLRSQRKSLLREAQAEAASLVSGTRREVDHILTEARKQPDRDQARALRQRLEQRAQTLASAMERTRDTPRRPFAEGELKLGDRVWVEFFKDHGTVVTLGEDGRRATVEIGKVRFDLAQKDLGRPRPGSETRVRPEPAGGAAPASPGKGRRPAVAAELNLVGQRVEEALLHLDAYLDDALLARMPCVRIIHGYGTGALRKAVHERLAKAGVQSFRLGDAEKDPGGEGVTLVTL